MVENERAEIWAKYVKVFNDLYGGEETRLGIFQRDDNVMTDYWIGSGMPLSAVTLDRGGDLPAIHILAGNLDHPIHNVIELKFKLTARGDEDGLDIIDVDGRTTVLRIEKHSSP